MEVARGRYFACISIFPAESESSLELGDDMSLTTMERRHIEKVLRMVNYHKDKACKSLKISRPTLNRKIAAYHLEIPGKKSQGHGKDR